MKWGVDDTQPYTFEFTAPNGSGFYEFEAVSVDNLGNKETQTFTAEAILCVPLNFTYELKHGWNLITVPINVSWNAGDLANYINKQAGYMICDTVVMLHALNQTHIGHPVGEGSPPGTINNFTIQAGIGYWVFLHDNFTLRWVGKPIENISVQLLEEFNLIGWANHCMNTTASSVVENITSATMAITYDSYIGYTVYIPSVGGDFDITIGRGFYVYCTTSSMWYGGRP